MLRSIFYAMIIGAASASNEYHSLLAQLRSTWIEYERIARQFQGEVVFKLTEFNDPSQFRKHVRTRIRQSDRGATFHDEFLVPAKLPIFKGCNDQYYFELIASDKSKPMAITRADRQGGALCEQECAKLKSDIKRITIPLRIFDLYLPEVILEPGFRILDQRDIQDGAAKYVAIRFKYDPPAGSKCVVREGEITLDPNQFWLIKGWSASIAYPDGTTSQDRQVNLTRINKNGIPLLEKSVQTTSGAHPTKGPVTFDWIWEHQLVQEEVNAQEFRLSHFGFPEPAGIPNLRTRWLRSPFLWSLVAALGCVGLIAVVRHVLRNRMSTTT